MECEKQVTEVITSLTEVVKSSKDFIISQAPDVVQQMISLEIMQCLYKAIVFAVFAFIFILIAHASAKKGYKEAAQGGDGSNFFAVTFFMSIFSFISVVATLINLYALLSVYFAPKVFILEQLIRMLGK